MKSRLIGWLLLLLAIACAIAMVPEAANRFLNVPTVLFLMVLSVGMSTVSFGFAGLKAAFWGMISREGEKTQCPAVIRGVIVHVYAAAGILCLIALIQVFSWQDRLPVGVWLCGPLATLLWALVIAECVLRPLLNHVQSRETSGNDDGTTAM